MTAKMILIAHLGKIFTIEWYYNEQSKSQAFDYFHNLTLARQKKLIHLLLLLGDIGKIQNKEKFRYEGDQLYVLKASPDRFFLFLF